MLYLSIFIFSIVWTTLFIAIGIEVLLNLLGGSTVLYFILPLILVISVRFNYFAKLIWSIILTLFGLILVNLLYSYFQYNYIDLHYLIRSYIVCVPSILIPIGLVFSFNFFYISRPKDINKIFGKSELAKNIMSYYLFSALLFLMPGILYLPSIVFLSELSLVKNPNSVSYQIALGYFIISIIIFLVAVNNVKIQTINLLAMPIERFETDINIMKRSLFVIVLIVLLISVGFEFAHRREWIIYSETVIFFILYMLFLFKHIKILYIPISTSDDKDINIRLPSWSNKSFIVLLFLLFLLNFLWPILF